MSIAATVAALGPDGPVAAALGGYEERPGQLAMAEAVARTLEASEVLVCEAGTGTGKTLAYLVPAILSGQRVVVSTATRTLQDQIFHKDLPFLAGALAVDPRAVLMKGLPNYLCLRRYEEFRKNPEALRPTHARALRVLESWLPETETGDLGELAGLGENDPTLAAVASSSDTRLGARCPHHESCFVTRMRRDAEQARLLVVNHHLFFADLALRGAHPGRVIPDYDAVVFDEAHQLEDTATDFFGVRVSSLRLGRLLAETERALRAAGVMDPLFARQVGAKELLARSDAGGKQLWSALRAVVGGRDGRQILPPGTLAGEFQEHWHDLDAALDELAGAASALKSEIVAGSRPGSGPAADALELCARRITTLRDQLAAVAEGVPNRVCWLELQGARTTVSSSPIDLADTFQDRLFDRVPAVVLTSATLATAPPESDGAFAFLERRLGLDPERTTVRELAVPSPFDYAQRAILYTPTDLPDPRDPGFLDIVADRAAELVELTDGGAFLLTTSLRSMRMLAASLRRQLPQRRILLQGEAPRSTLLGTFRGAHDAVLVATSGFWEGVDVPGEALRLVILEKIPFAVPTDPIVQARSAAIEAAGGRPFPDLFIPGAALALKQGFGRLIRTRVDLGIVALLDDRVHRRGYGKLLLRGLPPARRVQDMEALRRAWAAIATPE